MMFIADQAWFYVSARDALIFGHFPLAGITSSITWLHQGPLWTYMLIPALVFSNFSPISGAYLSACLGLLSIVLFYVVTKNLPMTILYATFPRLAFISLQAYHTAPLPLFELIFLALLLRRHLGFSALFMGFLYQLHLLTFIFWPFYIWFARPKTKHLLIFALSILPFAVVGPTQTFGIFVWIFKHLFVGFGGSSHLSDAYIAALLVPAFIGVAWVFRRLPSLMAQVFFIVFLLYNLTHLTFSYPSTYSVYLPVAKKILAQSKVSNPQIVMTGPGSQYASANNSFAYLVWWLSRSTPPAGTHTKFEIDTNTPGEFRVIE